MPDSAKLLVIGAITRSKAKYSENDIRERFSGGAMWGGRAGAYLGLDTTVLTIGADDIEGGMDELKKLGADVIRVPREKSTNFHNDYSGEKRKLYVQSFTEKPLATSELPQNLAEFNCIVLIPIFHELSPELLTNIPDSCLVLLDPSGFFRKTEDPNEEGLYPVVPNDWEDIHKYAGVIDILKLSNEDIEEIKFPEGVSSDQQKAEHLHSHGFPLVILTRAGKPTLIVGQTLPLEEVSTLKIDEGVDLDPAGAGEVFAVSFMYKYSLTHDPIASVKFANVCAGLKVSRKEYDLENVEGVMKEG